MLNLLRRRDRHQTHAPTPDRADLQIRNLLDSPELQAVMGPTVDADSASSDQQFNEPVAA